MNSNISQALERFIIEELMVADQEVKIDPDESLLNNGVVDSLALLRLISFIEEQFHVIVEDDEVVPSNFESLRIMESFVSAKL